MSTGQKPPGAGRSSFEFVDLDRVLHALSLTPSTIFLDLGCGKGNYALPVAESIGPRGKVYGVDAWREGLEELEERAAARGLKNITTIHANLNEHIPIEDGTVDVCFMATVLHDLLRESTGGMAIDEIKRVLKPGGRLSIIEFKKIGDGPGPPLSVRLSPEETEAVVAPFGFVKDLVTDVGPFHYLFAASIALPAAAARSPSAKKSEGAKGGRRFKKGRRDMFYRFDGRQPVAGTGTYVSETATVIGNVRIGERCYIGHGAILRGDYGAIEIGDETTVEEGAIIHAPPNECCSIGTGVVIGHGAIVHAKRLGDYSGVGMGAVLSIRSEIGRYAVVAEGAVVTREQRIPESVVAAGNPAKKIRDVSEKEIKFWDYARRLYVELADKYCRLGMERVGRKGEVAPGT